MRISEHFTCPNCGEHVIEEIMVNVTVVTEMVSIEEDETAEYGDQINEDGEVERYQCVGCGRMVAKDRAELLQVLKGTPKEQP